MRLGLVACLILAATLAAPLGQKKQITVREDVNPVAVGSTVEEPKDNQKPTQAEPNEKQKSAESKQAPSVSTSTGSQQGGAMIFLDPQTRQIREATPDEIGTLSVQAPAAPAGQPPIIQGPGGAVGIVLGAEFQNYTVVTKAPDGKLHTEEVVGPKQAQEIVDSTKTPKPKDAK